MNGGFYCETKQNKKTATTQPTNQSWADFHQLIELSEYRIPNKTVTTTTTTTYTHTPYKVINKCRQTRTETLYNYCLDEKHKNTKKNPLWKLYSNE